MPSELWRGYKLPDEDTQALWWLGGQNKHLPIDCEQFFADRWPCLSNRKLIDGLQPCSWDCQRR